MCLFHTDSGGDTLNPPLLEVIGACAPVGQTGLTDRQQQSKLSKQKPRVEGFLFAVQESKRRLRIWLDRLRGSVVRKREDFGSETCHEKSGYIPAGMLLVQPEHIRR